VTELLPAHFRNPGNPFAASVMQAIPFMWALCSLTNKYAHAVGWIRPSLITTVTLYRSEELTCAILFEAYAQRRAKADTRKISVRSINRNRTVTVDSLWPGPIAVG